jgi:hypothetical protein
MTRHEHIESTLGRPVSNEETLTGRELLHANVHTHMNAYRAVVGDAHALIFHHAKGVEHMVKHYGTQARTIAERHIMDDFGYIPRDHNDVRAFPVRQDAMYEHAVSIAETIY